jgi:hypothetical protein
MIIINIDYLVCVIEKQSALWVMEIGSAIIIYMNIISICGPPNDSFGELSKYM